MMTDSVVVEGRYGEWHRPDWLSWLPEQAYRVLGIVLDAVLPVGSPRMMRCHKCWEWVDTHHECPTDQ